MDIEAEHKNACIWYIYMYMVLACSSVSAILPGYALDISREPVSKCECMFDTGREMQKQKHQASGDTVINLKMKQPSPAVHSGWSGIPEAALILPARMWGLPITQFARTEGQNGGCHSTVAKGNAQTFQNKCIIAWSAWGSVDVGRKRWLKVE